MPYPPGPACSCTRGEGRDAGALQPDRGIRPRPFARLAARPACDDPADQLETHLIAAPVELPCPTGVSGPHCSRTRAIQDVTTKYGAEAAFTPYALLRLCGKTLADYPTDVGAGTQSVNAAETSLINGCYCGVRCHVFGNRSDTASRSPANYIRRNTARVPHAPVITAKPGHVPLSDGSGSTEIQWDTGNGSTGFVFVTEDGGKPRLFANGPRGTQVAPWIKKHRYIFELYADDQRQMLLATVIVSGSAESVSPQRRVSWQAVGRGVLIIGLAAVMYFAVYLSSTGPLRTTFPTEPTTSPRPLHVGRNLFLGIAAFICVDGVIFHTGLYVSILAPSSYAGRIAEITRAEKERASIRSERGAGVG